jgi:uncharacterized protein YrrD
VERAGRRLLRPVVSDTERDALLSWCEGYAVFRGGRELGTVDEVLFAPGGRVAGVFVDRGRAGRQSIPADAIEDVRPRSRTIVVSPDSAIRRR